MFVAQTHEKDNLEPDCEEPPPHSPPPDVCVCGWVGGTAYFEVYIINRDVRNFQLKL